MSKSKNLVIAVLAIALVIVGSLLIMNQGKINMSDMENSDVEAGAEDLETPGLDFEEEQATDVPTEDDVPVTRYLYIQDFKYYAPVLTINVGDTVVWENNDNTKHTVTSDTGDELDSPLLAKREKYSHTFTEAGEYWYHCAPHPSMRGRVIVK